MNVKHQCSNLINPGSTKYFILIEHICKGSLNGNIGYCLCRESGSLV